MYSSLSFYIDCIELILISVAVNWYVEPRRGSVNPPTSLSLSLCFHTLSWVVHLTLWPSFECKTMPTRCIHIHRSDKEKTRSGEAEEHAHTWPKYRAWSSRCPSSSIRNYLELEHGCAYLIMRDDAIIDTEPQNKAARTGSEKRSKKGCESQIQLNMHNKGISSRRQQEGSPTDCPD